MKLRRRAAVTLVEVMVASAVACMLFVVLWGLFARMTSQYENTQTHLEAMQSAIITLEYIENDLHGMVLKSCTEATLPETSPDGAEVSFLVSSALAPEVGNTPVVQVIPVRYAVQPSTAGPYGHLVRNDKVFPNIRLKKLAFKIIAHPTFGGQEYFFLRTTVTATDGTGKKDLTLMGLTALGLLTRTRAGRYWKPNAYKYRAF